MAAQMLDGEIITSFCKKCKCCSPDSHCGTCHVTNSIEEICGCGICPAMYLDYLERRDLIRKRRNDRLARESLKNLRLSSGDTWTRQ